LKLVRSVPLSIQQLTLVGQIYFVVNANHATPSSQPTASPCQAPELGNGEKGLSASWAKAL
ncbi:hypothetical protein, partial [Aetokthonos hydrillicola]|uniref:hypothetical protein n=1 Tax=Aetokthonos hydrillicola TaxID=1550245 RepID=UPI001ABBB1D1